MSAPQPSQPSPVQLLPSPPPLSLLSLRLEPPTQQPQQPYACNDCRYRCKDFRNLDQHIATKHQRPHHIPDLTLLMGDSHMKTVNCRKVEAALGGGKFVCGEHIAIQPPGRRSKRAGKPGRAYTNVGSWPNAKYTESSLEKVVPELLAQSKSPITKLVIQSPTSDLTNLRSLHEPTHKGLVHQECGAESGAGSG